MPVFPSTEWMVDFCARLEARPEGSDMGQTMAGTYRFVIEPGGPLTDRHDYSLSIQPDGDGVAVQLLDGAPDSARVTLSAKYPVWRKLIEGDLDVPIAFMLRRLRASGDVNTFIRGGVSAKPLMEALSAVDSQWLEDVR